MLQVLEALDLHLVSQKLMMTACFLAAKFSLGENLSFFLAEPIVGGVYDVCDDVFDDVGVVTISLVDISVR